MAFLLPQILVCLTILLPLSAVAQTNGNITVGDSLTATDNSSSWVSPSGDFAFGFRPYNGKDLYLLSIWFAKVPDRTIVWYANGDKPAPRGSKVELTADRGLVLTDPREEVLWTISGTIPGIAAYGSMSNTGNFVVEDSSFNPLWESFNNPTDTILPGQSMGRGGMLSSRQSETNFSQGRFQLRLLQDGNLVLNTINLPGSYANEAYYKSDTTSGDSNTSTAGKELIFNETGYICKPDFIQGCEEDLLSPGEDLYSFEELTNTDWPESDYVELMNYNEDQCRQSCLEDCMCAVAIFRGNTCWKKKLPLSNGRVDSSRNGGKALIKIRKDNFTLPDSRFPNSEPKKKNQDPWIVIGSVLLGGSVFVNIVLIGAVCLGFTFKKVQKVIANSSVADMNWRRFTYKELVEATDGFKEELGKGAFGVVYKGKIQMRSTVLAAVKKLHSSYQGSDREFKTEVNIIGQTHHKNLVRLLGFCDEGQQRLLVYEFLSNGTLADFLFGDSRPCWNRRIQIATAIARGLLYLHEECSTQIIHCDIKPQNILLDDYYTARISDFGLAKLLMMDQSHTNTGIRGTKGYVAPNGLGTWRSRPRWMFLAMVSCS
ncbi:G-type lectin S-receptor-like serine/threonine-protein kinase RLK1 [Morella rubra]|uniref:non-specific serine/threonine protein kinase n=1 Tax=Morella rubra TaxID=262757 RepID=A0A6A1WRX6_9ROSI|nr:G-type lectin S-receptor-like serine/threonine-protein kinase RLK1 [Morella rubra]